jgi:hypothetical protein
MVVATIRLYESEDQAENDNDASRCVGIEISTIHQNSAKIQPKGSGYHFIYLGRT